MATPQELLDEQKQKELDAKVEQAAKDVKTRETKENEDFVKDMKAIPKKIVDKVKKVFKSGGSVKSASKRADGCAIRGKTRA
jgi:tRNA A58 N-methylase Trm61